MKAFNLYRVVAAIMVLFAVGHTTGALLFMKSFGPQSDAVLNSMKLVTFTCMTSSCTWYGFYLGFGWTCTIFFLFSAFLTWRIPEMDRSVGRSVAWALVLAYAANAVLAWKYFFVAPLAFSIIITILLLTCFLRPDRTSQLTNRASL